MYGTKTIGVIVIAYNGEKYILEQLESIRNQTLKPDFVLISDDASTDHTVQLVNNYIVRYKLKNWQIKYQESNIGWIENVFSAIQNCDTDILFWADQDDIWSKNKIREMMIAMETNNNAVAVYSSWDYIDSMGNEMGLASGGYRKGKRWRIHPLHFHSKIPPLLGCSVCFNRDMADLLIKFSSCVFNSPDWLLYRLGIIVGSIIYIDCPLFRRRIHESNVTSSKEDLFPKWRFSYSKYIESIKVMNLQLKTIDEILFDSLHKNNRFVKNNFRYLFLEKRYLKSRLLFLKCKLNLFNYIWIAAVFNTKTDFFRTLYLDLLFRTKYRRK